MASLSLILSVADEGGKRQSWCARSWSRMILRISRVQVQVRGLGKLDPGGAYVFAANHLSMFDIFAFLGCLPFDFRFVAKASLFHWPFLGWHLKRAGYIRVDRRRPRRTLRAFRAAGRQIRSGVSMVIFPEGMRTWGKGVAPFKRGSFLLVRRTGASVVPVTIVGSHRRLPRGSVLIQPGKMEMIIHEPIPRGRYHNLKLDALARQVRRTIVESYQQVS
jgi:1-acyl-sn-glycerol-3-phosphate acyltransferase